MDINLEMQAAKRKSGLFYGWWVILGACLGYTASSSMNWVTSMVFPQLQKEMGWTAADLGFLLAATVWLGLLWAPFGGWLCDRIGNRWAIIVGLLIAGGAVLLYTTVHQIWQLFIFYPILTGIGVQIAGQIGSMSLPRKWFIKRSALAAGVIGGFWGITSSLIFPAVTELAASKGWRQTIFIMAPTIIIIAIAVIFFVVRDSPEKKGLHPDGVPDADWQRIQASRPGSRTVAEHNLTRSQALRTPQFWLIAFSYGVTLASLTIVQGNATLMAEWVGIPLSAAGTAMTALMIPAIFSRILVGIMGDRFGKKKVLVFTAACNVVIFFAGWLLVKNAVSLYIVLALLGFNMMAGMTLIPPLWGDLFGRRYVAGIMGLGIGTSFIISGTATLISGLIRQSTGGYNLVFFLVGCLFILQMVLVLCARPTGTELAKGTSS